MCIRDRPYVGAHQVGSAREFHPALPGAEVGGQKDCQSGDQNEYPAFHLFIYFHGLRLVFVQFFQSDVQAQHIDLLRAEKPQPRFLGQRVDQMPYRSDVPPAGLDVYKRQRYIGAKIRFFRRYAI